MKSWFDSIRRTGRGFVGYVDCLGKCVNIKLLLCICFFANGVRNMKKELLEIIAIASVVSLSACGMQSAEPSSLTSTDVSSDSSILSTDESDGGTTELEDIDWTSYTPVTVDEMLSDLTSNAYNASIKYKNQYFDITGIVDSIDAAGEYFMLKADDIEAPLVRCNVNSDLVREGLTEISIGGLAETCGIITGVDPEEGYDFDVASVKIGTEDVYADFLDCDIQGLIQYKIPESWTEIADSETSDNTYSITYGNKDQSLKDDIQYIDGIDIILLDVSDMLGEGKDLSNIPDDSFSQIVTVLMLVGESPDIDAVNKIASTFRTVKQGDVYGEIIKFTEEDSLYSEAAFFAADNTHVAIILFETTFDDSEFVEEANLVLNSFHFPSGISFQSGNEIVNMELTGENSVFGTFEELREGKSNISSEDQPTYSTPGDEKSNDKSSKSVMYSMYEEGNQITLSQYQQIKEGMTYQEVTDIVGSKGTLTSDSSVDGEKIEMYTWVGKDSYAVAEICFQNGKVISMTQFGLK